MLENAVLEDDYSIVGEEKTSDNKVSLRIVLPYRGDQSLADVKPHPTILMLMGGLVQSHDYFPKQTALELARKTGHAVITALEPGEGDTDSPKGLITEETSRTQIISSLDYIVQRSNALDPDNIILLGHSWTSYTILDALHSGMLKGKGVNIKAAAISAPFTNAKEALSPLWHFLYQTAALVSKIGPLSRLRVPYVYRDFNLHSHRAASMEKEESQREAPPYSSVSSKAPFGSAKILLEANFYEKVASYGIPLLCMLTAESEALDVLPYGPQSRLALDLKGAYQEDNKGEHFSCVHFMGEGKDAGHNLFYDNPDFFVKTMAKWLSSIQ